MLPWYCRAKILKNSRQWRVIEEQNCRRKGEIRDLAQSRLTLGPNPARYTHSNIKPWAGLVDRMYGLKVQGSSARRGRISVTLYGRKVPFCPSICVNFDSDRCDCASLCSFICAARRIQTLQIPGTNDRLWCFAICFGLETRPSVPNMRE